MLYANYIKGRMWNVSPRHMCWNTCLSPSGTVWESWGNYRSLGGRPWVALVPLHFLFNLGIMTVGVVWLVLLAPSCYCVFRCYDRMSPLNCEPAYSISPLSCFGHIILSQQQEPGQTLEARHRSPRSMPGIHLERYAKNHTERKEHTQLVCEPGLCRGAEPVGLMCMY